MTVIAAKRIAWSHRVRQLSDDEFLRDPRTCRVEGCDEPGRFERSWFFRTSTGRRWQRRDPVCETGALEFAAAHQLVIERPAESLGVRR